MGGVKPSDLRLGQCPDGRAAQTLYLRAGELVEPSRWDCADLVGPEAANLRGAELVHLRLRKAAKLAAA